MSITQDDLLQALRDAMTPKADGGDGEGWSTVTDMAEQTGAHDERIRKALRILSREGRLETVQIKRIGIDGRQISVPAYRIKPAA